MTLTGRCLSKTPVSVCIPSHCVCCDLFIDGPENPKLEAQPAKPFYMAGTSLNLSCQAEGSPEPTVEWVFGGGTLSRKRVLNLINVQTNQTGNYTCVLLNTLTGEQWRKNIPIKIYGT